MLEGTVSCVCHSRINTDDTVGISPYNEISHSSIVFR